MSSSLFFFPDAAFCWQMGSLRCKWLPFSHVNCGLQPSGICIQRERERGPLPCLANVFVVFWIGGGKEVVAELVTYEDAGHS